MATKAKAKNTAPTSEPKKANNVFDVTREVIWRGINDIVPYAKNSRTHSLEQIQQVADSLEEFGWTNPVLLGDDNNILAGHCRVLAAKHLGHKLVPCITLTGLTPAQQRAYVIADNKLALNAGWDEALLAEELAALDEAGYDVHLAGFTDGELDALLGGAGAEVDAAVAAGSLVEKFGCPPFSIIDTRQGYWQDRKKAWAALIGDNGESREGALSGGENLINEINKGVSILDGALAEILCQWFAKPGFAAFDPFAGDSVFGFVACRLGLGFTGIELRQEQCQLNTARLQADKLTTGRYICDDSANMDDHVPDDSVDFVFSCPPYADLEVYSEDPRDLSTMSHTDFFATYAHILGKTYDKLRNNRFAVVVTSEVRGKDGCFIGLVPGTIAAMEEAGYQFYNEIILINTHGTLPQRAARFMNDSRKVGRTHQNVLVFIKGDPKAVHGIYGDVPAPMEVEADGKA